MKVTLNFFAAGRLGPVGMALWRNSPGKINAICVVDVDK